MTEFPLGVPDTDPTEEFERLATRLGLRISRSDLARYPGCIHWHLTLPGKKGTLEATWWPSRRRLWLSVRSNRTATWQKEVIDALVREFSEGG